MREPARVALDDVSEHLGEVLRRADRLLAEWSAFGATVRDQVDREAHAIGAEVARSVDGAVRGAADHAIAQQIETRLAALATELTRVEQRARQASQALAAERASQRQLAWFAIAGILVANGLLVWLLLRASPQSAPAIAPSTPTLAPAQVDPPAPTPVPAPVVTPVETPTASPVGSGSAGSAITPPAAGSGSAAVRPGAHGLPVRPRPHHP